MNIPLKRVAVAQLCSTANKRQNLRDVAKCAHMAVERGAKMLFLPECFGFMGGSARETLENAEVLPPPAPARRTTATPEKISIADASVPPKEMTIHRWLSELKRIVDTGEATKSEGACRGGDDDKDNDETAAADATIMEGVRAIAIHSGLWISGGGIHERNAPPDPTTGRARVYNTHVIVDSAGEIVANYRKIHLFDVSIPSRGVDLRESATTAPGSTLVVCDTPVGKLGLATCYDLRFPEMFAQLAEEGGADILLAPSAFTIPTGKAHWHALLRARAIENQCYVLAAAQYGEHNEKRTSYGHSLAVDPWGEVVDAGGVDTPSSERLATPSIVTCDIDSELQKSIRERMPIQKHREASTFSW